MTSSCRKRFLLSGRQDGYDILCHRVSSVVDQVVADSNFKYVLEIKDVPKFKDART